MKSISLKPSGTALSLRIFAANARRTFISNNLTIAAISAGTCWLAMLAGYEILEAAAAFTALAAIRPDTMLEKGDEA